MSELPQINRHISPARLICAFSLSLAIMSLTLSLASTTFAKQRFTIKSAPSWVRRLPLPLPESAASTEAASGSLYLLSDHQIRVTGATTERYCRRVKKVLNASGLEDLSHLQLEFEPSYQELMIHEAKIIRGDVTIQALRPGEIKVIQQEADLNQRQYNGTLSALIFLNDVRVGDIVDYSYSVVGQNPVLGGRYADSYSLGGSQAIEEIHWRLIWPSKRALEYRNLNTSAAPVALNLGDETEYTWKLEKVAAIEYEDYTPSWFRQIPTVQLGEFSTWEDVVNWALPLYSVKGPLAASLKIQIERWRSEPDPEKRVLAALRFVQDDVRYMGIELGPNSHTPTQPSTVFDRRFGDCKDKSLLLTTILNSLGVEAYPALVNTFAQNTLDQWQPSPFAFDHVIVRAALDGKTHWIDATLNLQRGSLAQRYNPGYRRALVLRSGIRDLEEIPQEVDDEATTEVREVYTADDYQAPALLEVVTTYRNIDADQMRSWIAQQTLSELGKNYLNYYAEFDAAIEANGPPRVSDDPSTNTLVITENYKIPNFWKNNAWQFFAGRIYEELGKPGISKRSTPLALSYPSRIRQTIVARLPRPYAVKDSDTIANDAFQFRYQYASSGNTITLDYQLRTLRDHVPADRVTKHLETVARIRNSLSYELTRNDSNLASNIVKFIPFFLLSVLVFSSVVVFVIFKLAKRNRSRESEFTRINRFGAGQAPETAIQLNRLENITQSLRSIRCYCGAAYHDHNDFPETESAMFNGERLTVVRLKCNSCTRFQDIYFTFPSAAAGSPG